MTSMLEGMQKPRLQVDDVRFQDLSLQSLTLLFDVEVINPYEVPLPLLGLDYQLDSGNTALLNGSTEMSGSVPARGTRLITLPATLSFPDLLSTLTNVSQGDLIPYAMSMTLSTEAPVLGKLSLPIRKKGQIPVPAVPKVRLTNIDIGQLSLTKAAATLDLEITNPNSFGIDLSELSFDLNLSNAPIIQSSVKERLRFEKGKKNDLQIPISFSPANLGLAVYNILRGQGASYEIQGDIDMDTPFGALSLPYQQTGHTPLHRAQ